MKKHLITHLEKKDIGHEASALRADMEYSQLSKIERGVANSTISTAFALAEALGVPHHELFNFKFPATEKK